MIEPNWSEAAPVVVTMRFTVTTEERGEFLQRAREAASMLRTRQGCLGIDLLQSVDAADSLMITTRWDSMGSYRRAMSAYDIKEQVIPFLSQARDEDSTFETILQASPEGTREFDSGLAADAQSTRLGSASTASAPRLGS